MSGAISVAEAFLCCDLSRTLQFLGFILLTIRFADKLFGLCPRFIDLELGQVHTPLCVTFLLRNLYLGGTRGRRSSRFCFPPFLLSLSRGLFTFFLKFEPGRLVFLYHVKPHRINSSTSGKSLYKRRIVRGDEYLDGIQHTRAPPLKHEGELSFITAVRPHVIQFKARKHLPFFDPSRLFVSVRIAVETSKNLVAATALN
mmetsp:Transcript_19281/g.50104  ORF Transcript_19281/g.50104 Transcript_19281/m.50104 type:complete len:200 (+) Transcript_19281:1174-1773(+)